MASVWRQPQKAPEIRGSAVNHSIVTADRNTHVKVIVLALVAAIAVVVISFTGRAHDAANLTAHAESIGPPIKASKVNQFATRLGFEVR